MAPSPARADEEDRLFDFTDTYYRANGIDTTKIGGRREADGVRAVADTPPTANQRPVRALSTFPAYDHSGNPWFFPVLGGGSTTLFTADAAGRNARRIADASPEYVLPKQGTDPVGLGQTRQTNLLDMRNGYFDNNPLGIWIHVWVSYTDKAVNTADGRKAPADLARKNGTDLDGTPIIKSVGDINNLLSKGYVTKQTVAADNARRYALCPVVEDPTDGGIAPDQFLNYTKKTDNTPLEPFFLAALDSLRLTGRWPNRRPGAGRPGREPPARPLPLRERAAARRAAGEGT
ncbi:MAG: hypothetical protein K2X87_16530 [Gemmataceae bacterium]|nr:hypothetical protein [Gemmataceae bacterium]